MEESIYLGDNLDVLPGLPDGSFQLVYADPPFNTGRRQTRRTLEAVADEDGDRTGFKGRRYATRLLQETLVSRHVRRLPRLPRAAPARAPPRAAPRRGRSTSTSTTARRTTSSSSATRSSAASDSSTRSSGPTTTARAPSAAGRPSTTRSSCTSRTRRATTSTREAVDREPYMAPGLVDGGEGGPREVADRRLVAHDRLAQPARRRPATRRRSPWASSAASSRPLQEGATGASTRSRGAGRWAPPPPSWDGGTS